MTRIVKEFLKGPGAREAALNAEKENAQRLRKQNQFIDPIKSKNFTKEQILNFRNEIETKWFGNSTGTMPDR